MCATCGCSGEHDRAHAHGHHPDHPPRADTGERAPSASSRRSVRFERELLAKNAQLAADNRRDIAARGVALFNLIGSPGAGKTMLLESMIRRLAVAAVPVSVIEGDQATDRDARRIEAAGCEVFQINTGTGCHLDATMIAAGLAALEPPRGGVVFVENVGNLVCPALFDLGEHAKICVMSVTEGEDKPLKYPHVFRAADLLVLTKIDLQPLVGLDDAQCFAFARAVNPEIETLRVSAKRGDGMDALCAWFREAAGRTALGAALEG